MAYLIFNEIGLIQKIASNDTQLNYHSFSSNYTIKTCTDEEFTNVRTNLKVPSLNNGVTVFENPLPCFESHTDTIPGPETDPKINDEDELKKYFKSVISLIKSFIVSNRQHPLRNDLKNYKIYLEDFDFSSLNFPVTGNWEKYCEDNSITYYHPLQIP